MEQSYVEVLVARGHNAGAGLGKVLCGLLAVLSIGAMVISPLTLLLAAAFVFGTYYCYMQEWIEYEYTYISRELTVDKIMMRSRRKKVAVYLLDKMEIGAPENSYRLDNYKNRKCDVKDYSSRTGKPTFAFYYEGNQKVVLEQDEKLMKLLQNAAPSKMFLN